MTDQEEHEKGTLRIVIAAHEGISMAPVQLLWFDNEDRAEEMIDKLAALLREMDLTPRYGVAVTRKAGGYAVMLHDKEESD